MNIEDRLSDLKNRWFLMEPAYFMILCTHKIEINNALKTDIACGGGHVYINDKAFEDKSEKYFDEKMKAEMLRILLKHPYQRQLPNRIKMLLSSNFVIGNNTKFTTCVFKKASDVIKNNYGIDRASLEEIYDALNLSDKNQFKENKSGRGVSGSGANGNNSSGNSQNSSNSQNKNNAKNGKGKPGRKNDSNSLGDIGNNDVLQSFDDGCFSTDDAIERTQFWKEDDFFTAEVNNIINKIDKTNSWGTMPGALVDEIKKSIEPKFNYKAIFQQFRSSVLSSSRTITRMKPNRRFGYFMPGSKRNFTTKLLIAVDTSGSISDDDLQLALGFIKGFFKYGISEIDVVEFDTQIKPESLVSLSKAPKTFKIQGRGGTDFNDIFKFVQSNKANKLYDGVIILTDGYAPPPNNSWLSNNYRHVKYLWCINNENEYNYFTKTNSSKEQFLKFGKATYVDKRDKH